MQGLFISATMKSSGKTMLTMGLAAAMHRSGKVVQTFKKGPDYIDAMWLGHASNRPCWNLDFHTSGHEEIEAAFLGQSADADMAIIEGNKGLFDGVDLEGRDSNAAMAELLDLPVILIVDTRGITRGIAPLMLGYQNFSDNLNISGVIFNQVGGSRHEGKLRAAVKHYTDIPVLGAIGRHDEFAIAERHLGLMPPNEAPDVRNTINALADIVTASVDMEKLSCVFTSCAEAVLAPDIAPSVYIRSKAGSEPVRIAVAQDAAFGFYYPDDLQALKNAGADIVPFNTLHDTQLPEADALIIGGGFPEIHAEALSHNVSLRHDILCALERGMPAYAECGGLMYLSNSLSYAGRQHDMVGFVPGDTVMHDRPVGRGYVELVETGNSPWRASMTGNDILPTHEFHYASLENLPDDLAYAYNVKRGHGIDGNRDGLVIGNLVAGFSHHRQSKQNRWAEQFVAFASNCQYHAGLKLKKKQG